MGSLLDAAKTTAGVRHDRRLGHSGAIPDLALCFSAGGDMAGLQRPADRTATLALRPTVGKWRHLLCQFFPGYRSDPGPSLFLSRSSLGKPY